MSPAVKQLAARVLEALGAWEPGRGGQSAAQARLAAIGADPSLAAQAQPLLSDADSSAIQVVFAQYGGILASSASVLTLVRQWRAVGGQVIETGTTVDVRLVAGPWRVTELHPAAPGPTVPGLSAAATAVLSNTRITLPPAGLADIHAGQVHDSVLKTLTALSATYTIGISILRSGHPQLVFGTTRPSDHPAGRAFDTWRINDQPVVSAATPRSLVSAYMRAAADLGSYNVGGPMQLSGSAFFSDDTHHDHVHAGFQT